MKTMLERVNELYEEMDKRLILAEMKYGIDDSITNIIRTEWNVLALLIEGRENELDDFDDAIGYKQSIRNERIQNLKGE